MALARELLVDEKDPDAPFFVLNSDITSEFPFDDLLKYHKAHGKEGIAFLFVLFFPFLSFYFFDFPPLTWSSLPGTIMVTQVSEPSKYGVVVYDENSGKVLLISSFLSFPSDLFYLS